MIEKVTRTSARQSDEAERQRERRERSGELGEIRERCATLPGFIREAWPVLEPVVPLAWGWAPGAIAEHLTAVSDAEILRLLMNVPPGMMKSLMSCVFWPAWEWGALGKPGLRILGASFKQGHAERDTDKMRTLVSSDWYQDLWPEVKLKGKGAADDFANTMEGWRKGSPIASLTGDRGDRVIIDDPHSVEGGESDAVRKKTLRVMRETVPTRLNSPAKSAIVVIMQRVHAADVSGLWIDEKLFDAHLMLPMRFEPSRRCRTKIGFVDPRKYDGELLFPEQFPREAVDRTEKEMTAYAVAGQMQQRPVPREGGIYKRSWFEIVDAIPAGGVECRAWDLAGTKKSQKNSNPDWTVGLKGKRTGDGTFYVTGMVRMRESAGTVARTVKNTATQDGKSCHIRMPQDPGQAAVGQALMFTNLLAGWPLTIELTSGSGDKEMRARPAAAQAEFGMLKIVRGDWNEEFFDEVCSFPGGLHDDIVDALSDLIDELSNKSTFNLDNV